MTGPNRCHRLSFIYGTVIVFFSYVCYWLPTLAGIDPYLSIMIIVPLAALLGMAFYYGIFKGSAAPGDRNVSLPITVGLMYLMESAVLVSWKPEPRAIVTVYTLATSSFRSARLKRSPQK